MRWTLVFVLFATCAVGQTDTKPKLTQSYAKAAVKVLIAVRKISVLESTSPESPDMQRVNVALADAELEATSKTDKKAFESLKLFVGIHDLSIETCRSEQEKDRAMQRLTGKISDTEQAIAEVQKAFDDSGMTRDYKCMEVWKDALRAREPKTPAICDAAINP